MAFEETEAQIKNEEEQHLDDGAPQGDTNTTPETPQAPPSNDLDWKLLYAQSLRERNERDQELAQLRAQMSAPKKVEEPDITDEDIEKYGTTGVIKRIVAKTLRDELSSSLGDIPEISRDYKRNKQMETAESTFFSQFPHLAQFRETLAPTIRGNLSNAQSVDPNAYAMQAFATIGYYTAMNAANGNAPAAPPNAPAAPQNRNTIPPNRANGAPAVNGRTVPRLSELERSAMKKAGFDPNKREDVQEFMRLVNNDEGISV